MYVCVCLRLKNLKRQKYVMGFLAPTGPPVPNFETHGECQDNEATMAFITTNMSSPVA